MPVTPPWLKNQIKKDRPPVSKPVAPEQKEKRRQVGDTRKRARKLAKEVAANRGYKDDCSLALPAVDIPEPTPAQKLRFEEFARLFLVDFSQTRTAVRMGYSRETANVVGNQLFWHPYTQVYLVQLIRQIEEHTIVTRNEVLAGLLREAHNFNIDASSATRISAWKEIGKILGMYVQRVEISARSSGVMEVPMTTSVDQWERLADSSQTQLMEAVRA